MKRSDLLQLIEAALAAQQPSYAREAAERHLADWPGDLAVHSALGRALAAEGKLSRAAEVLETVVAADPEDFRAQRALGDVRHALGDPAAALTAYACAHVGDGRGVSGRLPAWAEAARAALLAQRIGDWAASQRESLAALQEDPDNPLPSLLHLAALWQARQLDLARPLAEGFHARWPAAIAFRLCLAECLLVAGDHLRAIELLHEAAAHDAGSQVVTRYWGLHHPYRSLWPTTMPATLPGPLPAALVRALGLNQLEPQPAEATAAAAAGNGMPSEAEELADIQAQLDKVAARLPSRLMVKHRLKRLKTVEGAESIQVASQPYYVVLSSRTRLLQSYGPVGFDAVHKALHQFVSGAPRRTGMAASLLYVDDPSSLSPFGLRPANPTNAWEIKTLLGRLAERLASQNAGIGALLIVGGAEIIPFHHLPNPTDDADPDIPSDNPYATPDENYFVPEWPVGRLPTGGGNDPAPLVHLIQIAASGHGAMHHPGYQDWLARLRAWLRQQWLARISQPSFGYSANVWRQASAAVYNLIGDPRDLLTSPPIDASALPVEGLAPSRLSYFNLHGIEDGPEWYGQRSLDDPASVPEYPVALRPVDVANSGRAPQVVFSEACYGANIFGKQVDEALCLKFLASGTRALVGSTKIAYGSVTTPLIGADLLGRCFWQNLNLGLPVGEALRRAKVQMAQEMHQRQGFLDGEDQKTLISFVLYGDPLAVAPPAKRWTKGLPKPLPLPRLVAPATVCDKSLASGQPHSDITPEVVAEVKSVVARYLPGMEDADWRVAHSHAQCGGESHTCPTAQLGRMGKGRSARSGGTTVVTLSKMIRARTHVHPHFARVTLDAQGKVVKLAVSR